VFEGKLLNIDDIANELTIDVDEFDFTFHIEFMYLDRNQGLSLLISS